MDSTHLVLVDKPIAESVSQARELGQLAGSKGLVLYAFQNRRWDSDFLSLRGLLCLPESHPSHLGAILEFESQSVDLCLSPRGSTRLTAAALCQF